MGDVNTNGRTILKWILNKQDAKVWTGFRGQDMVQWQVFVKTAMNLRVPKNGRVTTGS
jgi:hypothetical protein